MGRSIRQSVAGVQWQLERPDRVGVPFPSGKPSNHSQPTMSADGQLHQDGSDFLICLLREILVSVFSHADGKIIEVDHQLHQARPEILLDRHNDALQDLNPLVHDGLVEALCQPLTCFPDLPGQCRRPACGSI